MSKKELSINFPIERVVLSDLLPYEVPVTFSNRHFYHFIKDNNLKYCEKGFTWKKSDAALDSLILLLLGFEQDRAISTITENNCDYCVVKVEKKDLPSIPFIFPISHKQGEYRYLSLIHPKGQLLTVEFYNKFKDIITYYSDLSPFSLRSAKKVAGCTYIDSKPLIEHFDEEYSGVELEGQGYENLKSFFVYKKISNIFKFFESRDHHWCEKRFNHMSKLDITNCFDSLYTHSSSWAVFKKEFSKNNLSTTRNTFPSEFDSLMQKINYNETNGILIGPEVSRIFAEIILQSVDLDTLKSLEDNGYIFKSDFHIFRYVDDYFVFYNNKDTFEEIKKTLQSSLKTYKLNLNKYKEEHYCRPIITPITIAKKKVSNLLSDRICYKIERINDDKNDNTIVKGEIYIHLGSLITDFKSILSTSEVTYSDILNYSLSIIEKKLKNILLDYKELNFGSSNDKQLVNAIVSILNFSFFIYSVAPKVNSTIKLCRVTQQAILFIKDQKIGIEFQHIIFKCISDNICSILDKSYTEKKDSIETMYLLVLLRQLGKYYWLDQDILVKYFGVIKNKDSYTFHSDLNFFSISSLLFYISNKKRYQPIKNALEKHIENLYETRKDTLLSNSEMIHLSLDLITCPYIHNSFRFNIMRKLNIDKTHFKNIINKSESWYTKWNKFNFSKELDAKLSYDVY